MAAKKKPVTGPTAPTGVTRLFPPAPKPKPKAKATAKPKAKAKAKK